jgi:PAS domain S-box-containing protein
MTPSAASEAAFDAAPDGLVVLDPGTGRIQECNPRFAELADTDPESLVGTEIATLLTVDRETDGDVVDAIQGADGETVECRLRTDAGEAVAVDGRGATTTVDGADRVIARMSAVPERDGDDPSLERKARAMDEAPIGITMSDPDREDNPLVYVNEEFQRLTDYPEAEILGRNCRFLQGEATAAEPVAELRQAIDATEPVVTELRNYRKDGTRFWNRLTVAPVRDEDGTVGNFVGFQEDITERKRSERERELAYTLLETVPSGVLRTTPSLDGIIEYANPALASLLGAESVAALTGHRVAEFYEDPDDRAALLDALDDADHPVQREAVFETLDGERREVMLTASLSADETGAEHVHKVVQDITERKRYERRLREQRDDLDVLNRMLRHDIRNDLQLVTAYADVLADHVDEAGTEHLSRIQSSAASAVELTRTAGEMADVMLSAGSTREAVDLQRVLDGELDDIRTEHPEAAITVEGAVPDARVVADGMLDSVFRNLLLNAIQHNDKPVPEVRVSAVEDGDAVAVRIADNGPGIPDTQKESIFGKGEKGLESDGTGIGLYLVETLVEAYGGAVRVEDNEPEGAVFVVELPRADGA